MLKIAGYLKEISVNKDKSYFDTNTSNHHHFLDMNTNELIDLKSEDVHNIKIKKKIPGKKINSIDSFSIENLDNNFVKIKIKFFGKIINLKNNFIENGFEVQFIDDQWNLKIIS